MEINDILKWPDGGGWLVLSGGSLHSSEIRAQALARAIARDGGVAYIGVSENAGDATMDDMDDLGAPTGYLVNVMSEDDDTIIKQIGESMVVMIDDSEPVGLLRDGLIGAGEKGIRLAYEDGAIVLVEGASTELFGRYVMSADGVLRDGLNWLENALVVAGTNSLADSDVVQRVLAVQPETIAVGIGIGSALALGPGGQLETWGEGQVTIALGSDALPE